MGIGDITPRSTMSETFEQELEGGAESDDEAGAGEESEELELTSF